MIQGIHNSHALASMIDLSAVQTFMGDDDVHELVRIARQYHFNHLSVFNCNVSKVIEMTRDLPDTIVIGNISFPSGGETTRSKVFQAAELVELGCREVDMVINVGDLKSGHDAKVQAEIEAIRSVVGHIPLKVILEVSYLNSDEIIRGSKICIAAGASFVKTGTGWPSSGTTIEHVQLIKSVVGDQILIKASGGVRNIDILEAMYQSGARRFGINYKNAVKILDEFQHRHPNA